MIILDQQTPPEIAEAIAGRVRKRRKEQKLTQAQLAKKAGVSLGSFKRFEQQHEISLISLIKISIALGCENDFQELFSKRTYASIQEVIDEQ